MFESEISMLKKINHPHIINIKDASKGLIKKPNETHKIVHFIVLEMAENGELFDYLSFTRKGFGENIGSKAEICTWLNGRPYDQQMLRLNER